MKLNRNLFLNVFLACVAAGAVLWLLRRAWRTYQERQAALAWESRPQIGFGVAGSAAA